MIHDANRSCPRLVMTLLEERLYPLTSTRSVICRFWRMRAEERAASAAIPVTYAIGMETMTERYLYCVGHDGKAARELYVRMIEGRFSPIHLGDVVADFFWERENQGELSKEIPENPLQTNQSMV